MSHKNLHDLTTQVRRDILRMVHKVNSGHPGGSLGCSEFVVSLFNVIMKRNDGFKMDGHNEDIFFLSNGHISPVFYSVLARSNYFDISELNTFRLINSRLQGKMNKTRAKKYIGKTNYEVLKGLAEWPKKSEEKYLDYWVVYNNNNVPYIEESNLF